MDVTISYKPNPLLFSSSPLSQTPRLFNNHRPNTKFSRQRPAFRALAASNPSGSDGFSWRTLGRSVRQGSDRFWSKLAESVKKETGFDLEGVNAKASEFAGRVKEGTELERFRTGVLMEFLSWNKWELWKVKISFKSWV